MDLLQLSRDLISTDTVSNKGTAAAVTLLRPLYEASGLRVEVQEVVRDAVRQQNIIGTYPGTEPDGLLLVTHLDTVDPGPLEAWSETGGNPYLLTKKGDRLYGLGSADTKLDALCKLAAVQEFRSRRLRKSIQLLGTFEEEVGGKGARHFIDSGKLKSKFVSCSEPSELRIIRAHKGYVVVEVKIECKNSPQLSGPFERVVVEGKAAHSSTPHLGINAIEKAIELIGSSPVASVEAGTVPNKVPSRCTIVRPSSLAGSADPELTGERPDGSVCFGLAQSLSAAWARLASELTPKRNSSFDPDRAVTNWGVAKIHGATGQVVFDCRLLPGHDPKVLTDGFRREAEKLAARLGATVEVKVNRSSPAMELREPSVLLSAAREASREVGLEDEPQAKPTNTEAGIFMAAGVESMVFGPGRSTGNAHCANEHNFLSHLEKAIDFYRALIQRLCL